MERKPSQKPVRERIVDSLGFTRRPPDEPLTPGLRRREPANAIGFMADIVREETED